jgi:RimJ/RimL family protein N-acetyltransferase
MKNIFSAKEFANSTELLKKGEAVYFSERLTISLINQKDFNDITELLSDPNVNKYLFFAPSPVEVYEAFFNPVIEDVKQSIIDEKWSNSPVLIIRDHGNNFMGMVGLTQNHFLPGNFELGYQFPEKAWGKGIATLATEYALNIAFNTLEAYKVNADCYGENIGSKKVLEKSGFIQEGCQKEYYKLDFIIDDKALYGITRQQFIEFQKKK